MLYNYVCKELLTSINTHYFILYDINSPVCEYISSYSDINQTLCNGYIYYKFVMASKTVLNL